MKEIFLNALKSQPVRLTDDIVLKAVYRAKGEATVVTYNRGLRDHLAKTLPTR